MRGLIKAQYEPFLPEAGPTEVKYLLEGLNTLSRELMLKEERIKKPEAMRIEFVANVSHELRTPLTSIKGYTETLKESAVYNPQTAIKFLEKIEHNTDRLSSLILTFLIYQSLKVIPIKSAGVFSPLILTDKLEATFFPVLEKKKQILNLKLQMMS